MPSILDRIIGPSVQRRITLALKEVEQFFVVGARPWNFPEPDRLPAKRQQVLEDVFELWRSDPLARRIVELTTQYTVGSGITLSSPNKAAKDFLTRWWTHPLNDMPTTVYEIADELTRTGDAFIILSRDANGMTYCRVIPSKTVIEIETTENDLRQETAYHIGESSADPDPRVLPAWRPGANEYPCIIHHAINRPAGALFGESDLAPAVTWLKRYDRWLTDRVRLNYLRQLFLFVVKGRYQSESQRLARSATLNANPPQPGSILVTTDAEEWSTLNPRLESHEAGADGLAIKKMIAVSAGVPMHFLAEPESATRTTAEAAGGPTYRRFEQRQRQFVNLLRKLARAALTNAAVEHPEIDPNAEIVITGADISARDNAAMAVAASTISGPALELYDRQAIDTDELIRIIYRFAGETPPHDRPEPQAERTPPEKDPNPQPGNAPSPGRPPGVKIDRDTGEARGIAKIT